MENKDTNSFGNFYENKLNELQNARVKNAKGNKKGKKGIIIAGIALILAVVATVSAHLSKKKNNAKEKVYEKPSSTVVMQDEKVSLKDIGLEYDNPVAENVNKHFGNTTGDVKKEDIVEKNDTLWKDQEAADKSDNIGKTETDSKDDGLNEDKQEYEVKDENGETIDTGSNENGIPEGYSWDSVLNKYVKTEEVGKYVYVDTTYYAEDGSVIFEQGDIVLKETLEKAKEMFTTTKPETKPEETTPEETVPEETVPGETVPEETVPEEGVINPDGTYTIYGVTYKTKEDYEQFLLHPEQYGYYNGMVLSLEDIEELFKENQKTK